MRKWWSVIVCCLCSMAMGAQTKCVQGLIPEPWQVCYEKEDSVEVERLLLASRQWKGNMMVNFARQLVGRPYVAQTLEKNKEEKLVVNLRELDCSTLVETVTALTLCAQQGKYRFADYCEQLRHLRYAHGEVHYCQRLHYFSQWIAEHVQTGKVKEVSSNQFPFTAEQTVQVNFMSTHPQKYPMLVAHPEWVPAIALAERTLTGTSHRYIAKHVLDNGKACRKTIKDGDILAIVTAIKGLDIAHVGIAVWHADGLHLLNASQLHHKVVEEPMTLRTYMSKHPTQKGIRVVRLCGKSPR